MKKLILGIAVMTLGSLGAIALLFGTFVAEPAVYNGVSGWLGCFLDRGLLGPFTVFVAVALLGLALRWAWRGLGCSCGALGLLGDGLASCWAMAWLRAGPSSDAYSYDTLPIKFPVPEFISDTNNI